MRAAKKSGEASWREDETPKEGCQTVTQSLDDDSLVDLQEHDESAFRAVMDGVRQGSQAAIRRLLDEYGPVIRQVIRRRLNPRIRSQFDSIDFEQMVWASVFRAENQLFRFDSASDFCRFLVATARNKVVTQHRRRFELQKNRVGRECKWDTEQAEGQGSREPSPSQIAQARELASRVLRGHSEKNQLIMKMRMDGATYQEIADSVGIDVSTARRTVARITQARLRKPTDS